MMKCKSFEYAMLDMFESTVANGEYADDSGYYFNLAMACLIRGDFVQAEENMRLAAKHGGIAAKSVVEQIKPSDRGNNGVLRLFLSDIIQAVIEEDYPTSEKDAELIQQYLGEATKCFEDKDCVGDKTRAREALQYLREAVRLNSHTAFSILKSIEQSKGQIK